jgi:plasmid stabilization system protein ParE
VAQPIVWTEPAWRDLEQIIEYLEKDAPVYATVRRVHEAASTLGALPRRGRIVPELNDAAVRELILGNYRLIY